ncbi:hypothetical protein [Flavobacterium sp. J27]|uniref:hypothetical protein n=1 Tax=Flavobacterium sp. J27 TaxID=2060419 RepID=UPI001030EF13|nr:hypothetical protein [Flavobacterium sp. J27]
MERTIELVKKLEEIGETSFDRRWPNYVKRLNLKKKDSKILIEIISSSNLSLITDGALKEQFAPMHAWRALGQLQAKDTIKTLLAALIDLKNEEAFWFRIELPKVMKLIGNESIKPLTVFLKNNKNRWDDKLIVVKGLIEIAIQYPESKNSIETIINALLKKYKSNDFSFNACLLNEFFKLKPYKNELIKEIINQDQFDYDFINREELNKFIVKAKMYT